MSKEAEEYLNIALGGNMNISTLTLPAWYDIMDGYKKHAQSKPVSDEETRLFNVTYLGKDEIGYINKGIKIAASSEEDAMLKAQELNKSTEIYSAIEI